MSRTSPSCTQERSAIRADRRSRDYTVDVGTDGISAEDIVLYQPDPFGTGGGEDVSYTYRVFRPLTAYLSKTNSDGATLSIFFPITPHDALDSSGWFIVAIGERDTSTEEQVIDFTHAVMAQDIPIVQSPATRASPLGPPGRAPTSNPIG